MTEHSDACDQTLIKHFRIKILSKSLDTHVNNAQLVTNLQQTCSKSAATTCWQDMLALVVPSLLTRLLQACSRLATSLMDSTALLQVCSNNLLSGCKLSKLPSDFCLSLLGKDLIPEDVAKDLGVTFDCNFNFNDHIVKLTALCMSILGQINRVKHVFNKELLIIIIKALVFSKLFYCSSVWSSTSGKNIKKLQHVQNFAARIISGHSKYDHVTPMFALVVPSLLTRLLQACSRLATSLMDSTALLQVCSNNLLSGCKSTTCQQVVSHKLGTTWQNSSIATNLLTSLLQACYKLVASTCWQVVRFQVPVQPPGS